MKKHIVRRNTRQRRAILEELAGTREHPCARDLIQAVRRKLPGVSVGTVYRNLGFLRDEGRILELPCGNGKARYDGCTKKHSHFICACCGRLFDIYLPSLQERVERIRAIKGLRVLSYRLEFHGYCPACGRKRRGHERKS